MKETNTKKRVYENPFIIYEIMKAIKYREVVILGNERDFTCIRPILVLNKEFLYKLFELNKFYSNSNNLFISVAKFSWIPPFRANVNRENVKTLWKKNGYMYMYEYDFLIDFDCEKNNFKNMFKEVLNIAYLLKNNNIKYMLYPSSKKGFHIIIPSESFKKEKKFYYHTNKNFEYSFNNYIKKLSTKFKTMFNLKYMDLKGIGVWNKIRKCEFSFNKNIICKPILKLKNLTLSHISNIYNIKNNLQTMSKINNKYINNHLTIEEQQTNLNKFIKKFNLEV